MKDHSMGSFYAPCVAAGIVYLFTRDLEGTVVYLISYIVSLIAYFVYYSFKNNNEETKWSGQDIFTAFLASALAQWVIVVFGFLFGFPRNNY